ncbi:hypothetical protein CQW23_14395 [Capsicum baccatum]|uniref:Pentatricopeptide repeat-containing protein n=1 Tax=Capsicum baccatum TaxID=33114 RepID=A0A2G2WJ18_CAPBA|nr:hypothetical protein CQW23_14395 [Capsicum baccatum]
MPEKNGVSYNAMLSGYLGIGDFMSAWKVLDEMGERNVSSWNAMINGDLATLVTLAMKMGYSEDVIGTTILNAFTRVGNLNMGLRLKDAVALYRQVPEQTVKTLTAMMTIYAQSGRIVEARQVFNDIRNLNALSWNALLAGYIHNGMIEEAKKLFKQMPTRNVASWAAIISGLMHDGQSVESLELMAQMHRLGNIPSDSSFTRALLACVNIGDVEVERQIHSLSFKVGCQYNPYVRNGLITMCNGPRLPLSRYTVLTIPRDHKLTHELVPAVSTE